ncbi:hypothetical protein Y032_0045g1195 [Ancylostoma ceylanicum]|uniref:Uncharacterized protein n=1 Tax=Ancylostoma ceylanicum TaxID=53326 RepID=A0A016UDQ2_9BILA|nr:hypothetical protein Y032_0045g1195 [Ancylostoma ceylanicum]
MRFVHLRKISNEDRSARHEILNENNARLSRGRKRVHLSCDCDATSPYAAECNKDMLNSKELLRRLGKAKSFLFMANN